jgi:TolA-binding protein
MIRSQRDLAEIEQPQQRLTQTERLLLRYEDSRDWMRNNQRLVSGAAVVVVAIIAGLWWWAGQRRTNEEHAATYLSRAMNYYLQSDYRQAVDGHVVKQGESFYGLRPGEAIHGLKYIVTEFGSTKSGNQAALVLGNSYYALGLYDSANIAFDKASSDYPLVRASIEAGKAAIYEHSGNKIEAAKLFESAAHRDNLNPMAADYLLAAARDYVQADGHRDDAVKIYREVIEQYPNSQFDDAAKRELLKLNVEA